MKENTTTFESPSKLVAEVKSKKKNTSSKGTTSSVSHGTSMARAIKARSKSIINFQDSPEVVGEAFLSPPKIRKLRRGETVELKRNDQEDEKESKPGEKPVKKKPHLRKSMSHYDVVSSSTHAIILGKYGKYQSKYTPLTRLEEEEIKPMSFLQSILSQDKLPLLKFMAMQSGSIGNPTCDSPSMRKSPGRQISHTSTSPKQQNRKKGFRRDSLKGSPKGCSKDADGYKKQISSRYQNLMDKAARETNSTISRLQSLVKLKDSQVVRLDI